MATEAMIRVARAAMRAKAVRAVTAGRVVWWTAWSRSARSWEM